MILKIILGIFCFIVLFHLITKKYLNPYKLNVFIGKKGSGKSTLLTKLTVSYLKGGRAVYSTEKVTIKAPRKFRKQGIETISTKSLDPNKLFVMKFEEGSVLMIDEANLYGGYDNRQFKQMDPRTIEWYRLQRHYKVSVNLFTQSWDLDRKIRSLTDQFWIVRKYFRVFVIARRVIMRPVIVHPTGDAAARVADDFVEDSILMVPFGGAKAAFIPYWVKYFDSFKLN